MPVSQKKAAVSKFPLRLMPSVRRVAENFSQRKVFRSTSSSTLPLSRSSLIFNMRNG